LQTKISKLPGKWYISVILAPRRLRQVDHKFEASLAQADHLDTLNYIERPCLTTPPQNSYLKCLF
jgi:hypothetical protein